MSPFYSPPPAPPTPRTAGSDEPEVYGSMLVASRGESRHEVLQVIVRTRMAADAWSIGRSQIAHEVMRRDGRDPEALVILSAEEVPAVVGSRPSDPRNTPWLVTGVAFWRAGEDPT